MPTTRLRQGFGGAGMVKDLTGVRSLQRKHMPDKAGSDIDVQTSLRGIAKTASLNKHCISVRWDKPMRKRVQLRNRMRENRTSGTVWGVSGNRHFYHDATKNEE